MSRFSFFSFLLFCLLVLPLLHAATASPAEGLHLNCGSTEKTTLGGVEWNPDDGYISTGNSSKVDTPGIMPILSTVRYFPDTSARKYCYVLPTGKGSMILVRTTYFYGGFDGGKEPPVFDQIIGGTKWSTVDTSANYAKGLSSYFEIVVAASGKTTSVCLARNEQTKSSPFISAIEIEYLEDSMYNSANFSTTFLATIARHQFGHAGQLIRY